MAETKPAAKPTIYEAVSAAMAAVQSVGKTGRNTDQNYSFRGIDAVVNAVGPAFREHGIIPAPVSSEARYRDVQTSRGKPSRECTVSVTYRFHGPAGDFIDVIVPGESMDFGDKGTAKAMSVAYRIALLQLLCIPTDEPDADTQSYERSNHSDEPPPRDARKMAEAQEFIQDFTRRIGEAKNTIDIASLVAEGKRRMQGGVIDESEAAALVELINARDAQLKSEGDQTEITV